MRVVVYSESLLFILLAFWWFSTLVAFAPPGNGLWYRYRFTLKAPFAVGGGSKSTEPVGMDKLVEDLRQKRKEDQAAVDELSGRQLGEEEFCLVDTETGQQILLTREEKERIFLDAVQSYYYSGMSKLTNEQFDRLRSDLTWEGSALVTMNRNEAQFVNAIAQYEKGQPIMSDAEFEALKKALRDSNSKIAVATQPKFYMDTGVSKVTWLKDSLRTASLYVPATLFFTVLYLGVTYELPFVRVLFNPLLLLLVGSYPIYRAVVQVTDNFLFKDPLVAKGPCPSCGTENRVFFGDVLGVGGDDSEETTLKCTNCKKQLTVKRATLRVSTLGTERGPPARPSIPVGSAASPSRA